VRTTIAAVCLAVLLAGCSEDDPVVRTGPSPSASYGPAATGPHNDADVSFATDMIPHHAQAVEMADLALDKATNDKVTTLATAIKGAQDPEIRTMSGWLVGWGEKVPGAMHGGHSMSGMMSEERMADLEKASGAAFDRLWVDMMIEHHEGAVLMAREELAEGQSPDAKALAQDIIEAQNAEIATMRELAKTL